MKSKSKLRAERRLYEYNRQLLSQFEERFQVLENADECLHAKTSQDDSNPAELKIQFSTGFDP